MIERRAEDEERRTPSDAPAELRKHLALLGARAGLSLSDADIDALAAVYASKRALDAVRALIPADERPAPAPIQPRTHT